MPAFSCEKKNCLLAPGLVPIFVCVFFLFFFFPTHPSVCLASFDVFKNRHFHLGRDKDIQIKYLLITRSVFNPMWYFVLLNHKFSPGFPVCSLFYMSTRKFTSGCPQSALPVLLHSVLVFKLPLYFGTDAEVLFFIFFPSTIWLQ